MTLVVKMCRRFLREGGWADCLISSGEIVRVTTLKAEPDFLPL